MLPYYALWSCLWQQIQHGSSQDDCDRSKPRYTHLSVSGNQVEVRSLHRTTWVAAVRNQHTTPMHTLDHHLAILNNQYPMRHNSNSLHRKDAEVLK